jgi:hypothetical protein
MHTYRVRLYPSSRQDDDEIAMRHPPDHPMSCGRREVMRRWLVRAGTVPLTKKVDGNKLKMLINCFAE